ncbi:hypothetical protein SASPL_131187 [Salvia splendens]|uniref:Uncharacterized protein n=1 Tax=Salvia splendens TaxID=180675 RepID=A0A8X8X9N3_SALSN|nr:hypothetical protein SASPL_131187 [Salvia splendens]
MAHMWLESEIIPCSGSNAASASTSASSSGSSKKGKGSAFEKKLDGERVAKAGSSIKETKSYVNWDSWIEEAYGGGGAAPHPNPEALASRFVYLKVVVDQPGLLTLRPTTDPIASKTGHPRRLAPSASLEGRFVTVLTYGLTGRGTKTGPNPALLTKATEAPELPVQPSVGYKKSELPAKPTSSMLCRPGRFIGRLVSYSETVLESRLLSYDSRMIGRDPVDFSDEMTSPTFDVLDFEKPWPVYGLEEEALACVRSKTAGLREGGLGNRKSPSRPTDLRCFVTHAMTEGQKRVRFETGRARSSFKGRIKPAGQRGLSGKAMICRGKDHSFFHWGQDVVFRLASKSQIILKPIQSEVTKKKEDSTKFMASAKFSKRNLCEKVLEQGSDRIEHGANEFRWRSWQECYGNRQRNLIDIFISSTP